MPCILHIETSTSVCSVAMSVDGTVIFDKISITGQHSSYAGLFVQEALESNKQHTLDAVAVSIGPGSYTGLRIGLSLAKGLCLGYKIPLITIPTLKLLACIAVQSVDCEDEDLFCPMLDARRMEAYTAIYDKNLEERREVRADILSAATYLPYLDKKVYFFGDGSLKYKPIIFNANAVFINDLFPLAKEMVNLAEESFFENRFADVAYSEPFYFKEFQATTPRNKIIG